MNELMIHIERIVRPIHAMESRKLRMRQELLSHALAALADERARGLDEPAAIEQAKLRLGDPRELAEQLQQSVPRLDRLMLMEIPVLSRLDQRTTDHRRNSAKLEGSDALDRIPIRLVLPLMLVVFVFPILMTNFVPIWLFAAGWASLAPAHPDALFAFVAAYVVSCLSPMLGLGFVGAMVRFRPPSRLRTVACAIGLFATQGLAAILFSLAFRGRTPTASQFAVSSLVSVILLTLTYLSARLFVALRRPYEAWLLLEISN